MSDLAGKFNRPLKPIKWYRSLATARGRLEAGAFLIEGERAIKQIANNSPDTIIEVLTVKEITDTNLDYPARMITEKQLRSICSTRTPQGIVAVIRLPVDTYGSELPQNMGSRILLLEDIQDPGNVGTLIRTAAAFDYSGIILTEKCADPFSPKCIQSTAGTVLSVWMRRNNRYLEYIDILKKNGYSCISADLDGDNNSEILRGRRKVLLALGNEASGLSKPVLEASDYIIKISIVSGNAESLNVAVCGAICMYLSYAQV